MASQDIDVIQNYLHPKSKKADFMQWLSQMNRHCLITNHAALLCPMCSNPPTYASNMILTDVDSLQSSNHHWKIKLFCNRHGIYKDVCWYSCRYCSNWVDRPAFRLHNIIRDSPKVERIINAHDEFHTEYGNVDQNMNIGNNENKLSFFHHDNEDYEQSDDGNDNFMRSLMKLYDRHNTHYVEYIIARMDRSSYKFVIRKSNISVSVEKVAKEEIHTLLCILKELYTMSRDKRERICKVFKGIIMKITNDFEDEIKHLKHTIESMRVIIREQGEQMKLFRTQLLSNGIDPHDIDMSRYTFGDANVMNTHTRSDRMSVSIPTSGKELRKLIEGKSSIIFNLLTPAVSVVEGYAIVLPSEVIELYCNLGNLKFKAIEPPQFPGILNHNRCPHLSLNIRNESMKFPPGIPFRALLYWSDGAEMNNSKTNRSSGKIATLSVLQYPMPADNTFLIALGSSKLGDFDSAQNTILEDIFKLCSKPVECINSKTSDFNSVRFGLTTVVQDRPEHDDFTGCRGHGGTFSRIPGFSCPIFIKVSTLSTNASNNPPKIIVEKDLMSCDTCFNRRMFHFGRGEIEDAARSTNLCIKCFDWDVLSVRFRFTDKKDHPIHGTEWQQAKRVTFKSMMNAFELINTNVFNGSWPLKYQYRNFAKVECIKDKYVDAIHDTAKRAKENNEQNPPDIDKSLLPAAMRFGTLELSQCLVGVMHTVVLNGGRYILLTIKDCMVKIGKWNEFYKRTNKLLKGIRSLSLSWIKCWAFGSENKPSGGWLSENFLGFMTVSKAIASHAVRLIPSTPEKETQRVLLTQLIYSWYILVTMILQPVEVTDRHSMNVKALTKIFLQYYAKFEISLNGNDHSKKLESTSCLISLLNIPDVMNLHGTQRNLWEGSLFGEGMFRKVKPFVNRGIYTQGTSKNLLERHYKRRELQSLIDEIEEEANGIENETFDDGIDDQYNVDYENCDNASEIRYRSFHAYSNMERFTANMNQKLPLAAIYCDEYKLLFALVRKGRSTRVMHKLDFQGVINLGGMTCCSSIVVDEQEIKVDDIKIYISCAIIPMTDTTTNDDSYKFYVINEERMEYDMVNGTFEYPNGCKL